jgi:hypothetical protein
MLLIVYQCIDMVFIMHHLHVSVCLIELVSVMEAVSFCACPWTNHLCLLAEAEKKGVKKVTYPYRHSLWDNDYDTFTPQSLVDLITKYDVSVTTEE